MDRISIVPSPYFAAIADGRATKVASQMAGRSFLVGLQGAQIVAARKRKRMHLRTALLGIASLSLGFALGRI